ncbi:3643_t:CDS:2 [Dentiscutata erythropus]|uniref:3643_t:CDS:1 n=1 Tax=Dentiscutata erythropus TaxID=1348616 RepID=A0A9N8ZLI9_9GLOM|nr:3643_t:CDS:2 [Dentiscutata erythropus]
MAKTTKPVVHVRVSRKAPMPAKRKNKAESVQTKIKHLELENLKLQYKHKKLIQDFNQLKIAYEVLESENKTFHMLISFFFLILIICIAISLL